MVSPSARSAVVFTDTDLVRGSVTLTTVAAPHHCPTATSLNRIEGNRDLEPAPNHALAIEWQVFRIHHFGKPRVLHHLGIDLIAVLAGLVDDPGKPDRLALSSA